MDHHESSWIIMDLCVPFHSMIEHDGMPSALLLTLFLGLALWSTGLGPSPNLSYLFPGCLMNCERIWERRQGPSQVG